MDFDPEQLPLADFGLSCKGCGYPLANLTRLQCPECGLKIVLDDYIPEGAMPPLWADGDRVKLTADIAELFTAYQIPYLEIQDASWGMLPMLDNIRRREGPPIGVPRERYFEAIDLLRRVKHDEPLPPPPPKPDDDAPDWACPACGEENPGHFEVCWQCQAAREGQGGNPKPELRNPT